jgi:hypothetical protein
MKKPATPIHKIGPLDIGTFGVACAGLCQLPCIDAIIKERGKRVRCRFSLGSQCWGRNLPATLESFLHLLTRGGSGESMPVWTEMLGDGSISRKEPLGMAG